MTAQHNRTHRAIAFALLQGTLAASAAMASVTLSPLPDRALLPQSNNSGVKTFYVQAATSDGHPLSIFTTTGACMQSTPPGSASQSATIGTQSPSTYVDYYEPITLLSPGSCAISVYDTVTHTQVASGRFNIVYRPLSLTDQIQVPIGVDSKGKTIYAQVPRLPAPGDPESMPLVSAGGGVSAVSTTLATRFRSSSCSNWYSPTLPANGDLISTLQVPNYPLTPPSQPPSQFTDPTYDFPFSFAKFTELSSYNSGAAGGGVQVGNGGTDVQPLGALTSIISSGGSAKLNPLSAGVAPFWQTNVLANSLPKWANNTATATYACEDVTYICDTSSKSCSVQLASELAIQGTLSGLRIQAGDTALAAVRIGIYDDWVGNSLYSARNQFQPSLPAGVPTDLPLPQFTNPSPLPRPYTYPLQQNTVGDQILTDMAIVAYRGPQDAQGNWHYSAPTYCVFGGGGTGNGGWPGRRAVNFSNGIADPNGGNDCEVLWTSGAGNFAGLSRSLTLPFTLRPQETVHVRYTYVAYANGAGQAYDMKRTDSNYPLLSGQVGLGTGFLPGWAVPSTGSNPPLAYVGDGRLPAAVEMLTNASGVPVTSVSLAFTPPAGHTVVMLAPSRTYNTGAAPTSISLQGSVVTATWDPTNPLQPGTSFTFEITTDDGESFVPIGTSSTWTLTSGGSQPMPTTAVTSSTQTSSDADTPTLPQWAAILLGGSLLWVSTWRPRRGHGGLQ